MMARKSKTSRTGSKASSLHPITTRPRLLLASERRTNAIKDDARFNNGSRCVPLVERLAPLAPLGPARRGTASALRRERTVGFRAGRWVACALLVLTVAPAGAAPPKLNGLLHNEDCGQIFVTQKFPPGKAGEVIDHYVDVMADAGVSVFLCNTNDRRTNYRSDVWESYWSGFDPAGPDNQPFLAAVPRQEVALYRNVITNMRAVHEEGIDFPARVIARCRHHKISPWISLRMNDCHNNNIPDHPFHGSFWRNNPQFRRQNSSGYFATCLDYARPEVRDFFKALVKETLNRYDIDGIELDFMREPYLFSADKEQEGAKVLTAWLREIRALVDQSAARRGHAIGMGVRVPSRPRTALALGLDAPTWSRDGLIDLLVVTPRWATLEFDMRLAEWRRLIDPSRTTIAGGLEVRYQPYPGSPYETATPELARGAAACALSGGADVVYLFNYFQGCWTAAEYQRTLRSMRSLDSLLALPRTVAVTYRDVTARDENYRPPLPMAGKQLSLAIKLGPVPKSSWVCSMTIEIASTPGQHTPAPTVAVNDVPCLCETDKSAEAARVITYKIPLSALSQGESQAIKITDQKEQELTLRRIELSLSPKLPTTS